MITEKLMSLGSWTISLDPDRTPPDALGNPLRHFGTITVLPQRVNPNDFTDAQMLSMARYSGMLRQMDWDDNRKTLSGPGLLAWLGDETGKGYVYEVNRHYDQQTFENTLWRTHNESGAYLASDARYRAGDRNDFRPGSDGASGSSPDDGPPGLLRHDGNSGYGLDSSNPVGLSKGTVDTAPDLLTYPATGEVIRFSENIFAITAREALAMAMDAWGAEFRVNADGSLDAGLEAFLFVTNPTTLIVRKNWGDDPNYNGVPALAMRVNADTKNLATSVFATGSLNGTTVLAEKVAGWPGGGVGRPIENLDFQGNNYHRTALVNEPVSAHAHTLYQIAKKWYDELSTISGAVTVNAADFNVEGQFEVGDTVMLFDPETEHYDLTQEVAFRGDIIYPKSTRVTGMTWPVTSDMGVYYRASDATWTDISDWVVPDDGNITLEVGFTSNRLRKAKPFDSGSVVVTDRNSVPAPVTNIAATTGSYEYDDPSGQSKVAAWIQVAFDEVTTNDTGTTATDLHHYDVRWRPGVNTIISPFTGDGFGEGFGSDAGFTEFQQLIGASWETTTLPVNTNLTSHAVLSGAGYLSAPHIAAYEFSDLDIMFSGVPDDYTPTTEEVLVARQGTSLTEGWAVRLLTTGYLQLRYAVGGTTYTFDSPEAVSTSANHFRVTREASSGIIFFYESEEPVTITLDNVSWNTVGLDDDEGDINTTDYWDDIIGTLGTLSTTTADLTVGARDTGLEPFNGTVYAARLTETGADTEFDASLADLTPTDTSFTESSTNAATVTLETGAVISRREIFVIDALPIDTYYEVEIRAVDIDGNASEWVAITQRSGTDTYAPSAPGIPLLTTTPLSVVVTSTLGRQGSGHTFDLQSDLAALNVYASTTNGFNPGPDTLVTTILASAAHLKARIPAVGSFPSFTTGTTYVLITAVDAHGNESEPSHIASVEPQFVKIDDLVPNLFDINAVKQLPTFNESTEPAEEWYYLTAEDNVTPGHPYPADTVWSWDGSTWNAEAFPEDKAVFARVYAGAISSGVLKTEHFESRTISADIISGGSFILGEPTEGSPAVLLGGTLATLDGGLTINVAEDGATTGVFVRNLTADHITSGEFILQQPSTDPDIRPGGASAIQSEFFSNDQGFRIEWGGNAWFNNLIARGIIKGGNTVIGNLANYYQETFGVSLHGITIDSSSPFIDIDHAHYGTPTTNLWVQNPETDYTLFRASSVDTGHLLEMDSITGVRIIGDVTLEAGSITGPVNVIDAIYMPDDSSGDRVEMVGGTTPWIGLHSVSGQHATGASIRAFVGAENQEVFRIRPVHATHGNRTEIQFRDGPGGLVSYADSGIMLGTSGRFQFWDGTLDSPHVEAGIHFRTKGYSDLPILFHQSEPLPLDGTHILVEAGIASLAANKNWFARFLVRGEGGTALDSDEWFRFGVNHGGYVFLGDVATTPPTPYASWGPGIHLYSDSGVLKYVDDTGSVKTVTVT
jgi:hypothetical protein